MTSDALKIARTTFTYERIRAFFSGIIEPAGSTFFFLIALLVFHASPTEKALVAAAANIGLLFTPFTVWIAERGQWSSSRMASVMTLLSSISFLISAFLPFKWVFISCSLISFSFGSAIIPLITQIYQDNYPPTERGRFFSRSMIIRILTVIVASQLLGVLLNKNLDHYRWLLIIFSMAFAGASYCLYHCPSRPLTSSQASHPFQSLSFLKEDRVLRWMTACWMLLGFANLMMVAIRVEFLANPRYGLSLDVLNVTLLTSIIPNMARLMLSTVWGKLFDQINFIVLRILVNLSFALGILAFFTGTSYMGLVTGAVIFGVSIAGGDVAWSLWVTKCAPPKRVAHYMSIHTFFTGVRGLIAPLVAFHLIETWSIETLAWFCATLIIIATLMLLPELKVGKTPPTAPLGEDSTA